MNSSQLLIVDLREIIVIFYRVFYILYVTSFPGSLILPPGASEERLSSLTQDGKMRDPGNEVVLYDVFFVVVVLTYLFTSMVLRPGSSLLTFHSKHATFIEQAREFETVRYFVKNTVV